ncbi:TIGR03767 family metallophosphoesterase [Streptomyces europaeiscabiei]|uniref:TIGR03767 family metallophosphoesterase n=1 Tax=Streptomyces europaeiscabiei TaxID=146819 RepID=A0ABU4NEE5_9ACTN|nr:TIGR03767 family metallophosphoesterase [Streptomyces europaeiscabiei]MDX2762133.1 TIGR03767 family metallophosphoesterase [Streptomyces europaeiscabiei]MDX3541265.1 TIGR03767 family metallophosphoesterase [Streptomyces europaeiscabiei]MDX3551606.1 TIGR03767 family metallophosphoesterase [Streptomyces europaeiscabiei]MDX3699845.1 TIGR03767 family metallophosphoesterase [Streptomyces europaeiscabiei]
MSRIRSVAAAATNPDRRAFLAATGAVGLAAGVGFALRPETDAHAATAADRAAATEVPLANLSNRAAPAAPLAPYTRGTTLASVATPRGASGYRRLGAGPAWARVVRGDLATPKSGREKRRTALASFVQFTDLHVVDVQHPLRYEYLRSQTASAWRPQEALSVAGAVSLVERVNALRGAPVTGSPLHFVMTTGDNTDNNSKTELDWFLKVMSGGRVTPNSGDPRRYEGVQDSGLKLYWQPDAALRDADKQLGFPRLNGFLAAAIREVNSPGLNVPWYSTVGNHDSLPGGCYAPGDSYFADFAVGGRKLMTLDERVGKALWDNVKSGGDPRGAEWKAILKAQTKKMRSVTPDEGRAPFTPREYLKAHLDPAHTGPGPVGHGYSQANLDARTQYYAFRIADDVIGISLDSTDPGGHYEGSLGTAQLKWLERTLKEAAKSGSYAVVFSHHTSASMRNLRKDPSRPGEARHGGDEVLSLLGRQRNVLAWVNGHSHRNRITPHGSASGGSFWEISTASHIDFPQLARVIELVDNKDGTISLFTTLIESAAPHSTDFTDLSQTGLAALYRELSYNAPGRRDTLTGTPGDRNAELVLRKG